MAEGSGAWATAYRTEADCASSSRPARRRSKSRPNKASWPEEQPALQTRRVQSRRSCFLRSNSSSTLFCKRSSCGRLRKKLVSLTVRFSSSSGEFVLPFAAGQQTVVAVERIDLAGFEPALKAVFQEVRAALVEKHAAFLIDERLQKLEFCFGELNLSGYRSHDGRVRQSGSCRRGSAEPDRERYFAVATVSAASSSLLTSW